MNYLAFSVITLALILASVMDIRYRSVPNWITYPGILITLSWFNSRSALYLLIALLLLLVPGDLIGAGDIKLSLMLALWSDHFSWSNQWLLCSLIFGGIAAIWLQVRRRELSIAFAPYLAVGFIFANLVLSDFVR